MIPRRRESGIVLLVVLTFALLLTSSIATFVHRATIDTMVSRNRDAMAQAEALARGGVRLATALLLEDRLQDEADASQGLGEQLDTSREKWARMKNLTFEAGEGATLRLDIQDSGAWLNLNALIPQGDVPAEAENFVQLFLEKVIEEMDAPPGEKALYDPRELAAHLIDYVDEDEIQNTGGSSGGGLEDDYYQLQDPPYKAANRPLLSVEELRLIEGFDGPLVEALRPYVTVYPYAKGGGVNLNTAPSWVLSLIFYNDRGSEGRLIQEDLVRRILEERADGRLLCQGDTSDELCTPIGDIVPDWQTMYPAPTFTSQVFTVYAEARVGEVRRGVEAVIDRTEATEPLLLSWRVR